MPPIKLIQQWLIDNNYDAFIVNRTDEFLSEYIAPYAERLYWISNFSGSAGRAIIERNIAYIFIDGRYTNQANIEVDHNNFKIKHLSNYWSYFKKYKNNQKIVIDPFLHSINEVEKKKNICEFNKTKLSFLKVNPIDLNWKDQPSYPKAEIFSHPIKFAGEDFYNKIKKVQNILKENFIDSYFLNSLDSIAWLLNIRGNDIENTPIFLSYAIIPCEGKVELFIDLIKIKQLGENYHKLINFNSFAEIDNYINTSGSKKIIGMDEEVTPSYFKTIFLKKNFQITNFQNPCLYLKAVKNIIELAGAKKANLRDGVSISKFLFWLKNKIKFEEINEIIASDYLLNLRKKNELYYSPSFETISAFGPHAALPHYRVTLESNLRFKDNSIYLVDSGAQYKDGTTDITRTIIIGKANDEQKDRFTRVLKGHIALAQVVFPLNTRGSELDYLSRQSLQEINCDFDHGTGHGIGSFLSVHEGPQKIFKSHTRSDSYIYPGMILSNEPGYYKEGEYGIRIENLLICQNISEKDKNLYFETISWAPIDKDLINISILNENEINWLNDYHQKVNEKISPRLNSEEKKWLYLATSPIN